MDEQQKATEGSAMALVKVQARGQVTLPSKFREALGIEPGHVLMLQQAGERRFLVEVIPRKQLVDFPTYDVDVDMRQVREDMGKEIADRVCRPGDSIHDIRRVVRAARGEAAASLEAK